MRFSKWHAAGNVYLLTEEQLDAEQVRALVGDADGILEVKVVADDRAEAAIWNRDGSQAEMSGNGTRIVARWLSDRTGTREVVVSVGLREVSCRMLEDGTVEQDLGEVTVHAREKVAGLEVTPVSVGNPHAVVLGDPDDLPLVGPLLEAHPRFPQKTNVQVARVDGPGRVSARVWERGVGETRSSGTGAVAVAAATHPDGGDVLVRFPGGVLRVRLEGGHAFLSGPAEPLRVPRQVLVFLHRPGPDGLPRFLLLRRIPRNGGFWQGITGAPEWGETDEEAAVREVREETGLDVSGRIRSGGYGYQLQRKEAAKAEWERLYGPGVDVVPEDVYSADAPAGWEPALSWEHDDHRWCGLDEALSLLRWEENRDALRVVVRSLTG
jgi:diaminopimelate epimerase